MLASFKIFPEAMSKSDGQVKEFTYSNHSWPRRVLAASRFKQLCCHVGIGYNNSRPAANPDGVDRAVYLGPLLELNPRLRLGQLELVADEGQRYGPRRHPKPCHEVVEKSDGWQCHEEGEPDVGGPCRWVKRDFRHGLGGCVLLKSTVPLIVSKRLDLFDKK